MGMRMLPVVFGACAFLASPGRTAETAGTAEKDYKGMDTCIAVELIMYSGRPRPLYFICEETEKRDVLAMLAGAKEGNPADRPFPKLESTPVYQGVFLTLPGRPGESRAPILVRKGFVKSPAGTIRKDAGRSLEKFLLKRSLREPDMANSPAKGTPLSRHSEIILDGIGREPAE